MDKKFWIAGAIASIILALYSFIAHGLLLHADHHELPDHYRSGAEVHTFFPFLLVTYLVKGFAFAWIYRQGISQGVPWLSQGVMFGIAAVLLITIPFYLNNYATQPLPGTFVAKQIVFDTVGMILTAVAVAFINRSSVESIWWQNPPLKFLQNLSKNNNRDWFLANKKLFDAAHDYLTAFTGQLIGEAGKFDDAVADVNPKSCVFRIYRDVPFSKDKSPYKTNLGAYISPGGRKSMQPGYYFHVQPGCSFIAGGKHMPDGSETLKIRNAIASKTDKFLKIVEKKSFRGAFGEMTGDRLKSAPKGFDTVHKALEYLKLKEFMAFTELKDDKFLISAEFPKYLVELMKEIFPLIACLRNALQPAESGND